MSPTIGNALLPAASISSAAAQHGRFLVTAGADVLRDEGEAYAMKLRLARGLVTAVGSPRSSTTS